MSTLYTYLGPVDISHHAALALLFRQVEPFHVARVSFEAPVAQSGGLVPIEVLVDVVDADGNRVWTNKEFFRLDAVEFACQVFRHFNIYLQRAQVVLLNHIKPLYPNRVVEVQRVGDEWYFKAGKKRWIEPHLSAFVRGILQELNQGHV